MAELSRTRGALALTVVGTGLLFREAFQRSREADLRGRVALVTGGSRGLGLLLARELARVGCRLSICARDAAELDRARQHLAEEGVTVHTTVCDLGDRAQVERWVQEAARHLGPVDILVNNAGVIQVGPMPTMRIEDFRESMDVMFWGVLYPTLAVLPQMRARRSGRIVNVTSIGGKISAPHLLPYDCAKFAAVGLSEGLRAELAREGITVTTIVPGFMRTGSYLNTFLKGQKEAEFLMFAPPSSLPLISMDAERAARQIVTAARRGEAERILTLWANLAVRFHGLFPGITTDLLGLANRFLPGPGGAGLSRTHAMEVWEQVRSPLLTWLTGWGLSAARRFNQFPGPVQVLERERSQPRSS